MALAYDSSIAVDPGTNLSGSYSTAFTNTAGNVLVVSVWTRYGSAYTSPSSVTYNGVNLTKKVATNDGGSDFSEVSIWGLESPATGSNTLTVNLTGTSIRNAVQAVTLSGADAAPFGATGGAGSASSPSTGSFAITTTVANSFIIAAQNDDGSVPATVTGTNQTTRASVTAAGGYQNSITTQTTTTTGSYTNSWSFSGASGYAASGIEIKPVSAVSVNSDFLVFM